MKRATVRATPVKRRVKPVLLPPPVVAPIVAPVVPMLEVPPSSATTPRTHIPLWQRPIRAFVWTLDLCDGTGDPSMAKGIAGALAMLTLYDIARHGIHAGTIGMAALVVSAAFGRSVFMRWIDHNEWKHTLAASTTLATSVNADIKANVADIITAIKARRDPEQGIESSGKVLQVHND